MKRLTKTLLIIIAVLSILLCIACCLYIYQYFRGLQAHEQISAVAMPSGTALQESTAQEEIPENDPVETDPAPSEDEAAEEEPEDDSVSISIDFDALAKVNEEIYAWLEIPGTSISYAIVQSETDDLYYNTHAVDKSYYTGGSLYTQRYNTKAFDDPMTLVYGHNFHDNSLFAPLLNYIDVSFFEENRNIYIYTPDAVYVYDIFAAYPHTSEHLLLCYDFSTEEGFREYFDALSTSIVHSNFDEKLLPQFGDKVLTLSTCYRISLGRRYLVQGVLTDVYPVAKEAEG